MDQHLTASQRELRDSVREFAQRSIRPSAQERSDEQRWDSGLWRAMGENAWPGDENPETYGGLGGGPMDHAVIVEELSRVDASLGAAQNLLQQTVMAIISFGTAEQKETYLPRLARGEGFSITGITEAGAGSKLSDMNTRGKRVSDGWTLDGVKTETHIPSEAIVALIFAKTEEGISAFLVDTAAAGFASGRRRSIIGLRGLPMYSVRLKNCGVSKSALLGDEGDALSVFFKSFDLTRIGNAAKSIGIAAGALEESMGYARTRKVGDSVVTDFQGIRWQLVDLITRIDAARLMMYHAASVYNEGGRATEEAAKAKLLASTTAMDATVQALQITGSHGCFSDQPFARYMQDAKVSQITGGTVEILRNTIARTVFDK